MKKLYLSILYVVLLSLLIGSAILFSKPGAKIRTINNTIDIGKSNMPSADDSDQALDINAYKGDLTGPADLVRQEEIDIFNNESRLDLHASLTENENGQVTLNLAYKLDGKLITKSIDASNVVEIRNIFRFRDKYGGGYKINNMLLDDKKDRLYFCVEGKQEKKYFHTTIYSYDLKNSRIDKLYYDIGVFGDFFISPDGKYNAFTYLSCPQNISYNEKNSVVIIRCSDNKLILDTGLEQGDKLRNKSGDLFVYSYDFIKWNSGSLCELREKIKAKDGSQMTQERKLYYNTASGKLSEKM